jgi:hypothetical protein
MIITRRNLLAAGAVLITVPAIACSAQPADSADRQPSPAEPPRAQSLAMTIHRDPGCPCCDKWAELARKAGYQVSIADDPAIADRKRRLGVPEDLWSCHTVEVGGLVFEGHVPLESVDRLLNDRDPGIIGLAVAGMPLGSPGMETNGATEAFEVIAFDRAGKRRVFTNYPAAPA